MAVRLSVMPMTRKWLCFLTFVLLAGCTPEPPPLPAATPLPIPDPYFAARGGGEPRGTGYWRLWNSCAPDNRAETAAANGGRAAGWIIMDDLLADPGVLLGDRPVVTCEEGVRVLQQKATADGDALLDPLAAQLLATQLNLAAGAEHCPAVDEAVQQAQLLLLATGYNGGGVAPGADLPPEAAQQAALLVEQLATYNTGALCR